MAGICKIGWAGATVGVSGSTTRGANNRKGEKKRRQAKCGHVQKSIGPFAGPSLFWASVAADPLARSLANAQHVLHIGACRHKSILGRRLFFPFFFSLFRGCVRGGYTGCRPSGRQEDQERWNGEGASLVTNWMTRRRGEIKVGKTEMFCWTAGEWDALIRSFLSLFLALVYLSQMAALSSRWKRSFFFFLLFTTLRTALTNELRDDEW